MKRCRNQRNLEWLSSSVFLLINKFHCYLVTTVQESRSKAYKLQLWFVDLFQCYNANFWNYCGHVFNLKFLEILPFWDFFFTAKFRKLEQMHFNSIYSVIIILYCDISFVVYLRSLYLYQWLKVGSGKNKRTQSGFQRNHKNK